MKAKPEKRKLNYIEDKIKKEFSSPFIISIKNLTDKRIENVSIIDYKYKERKELKYLCGSVGYDVFLRQITSYPFYAIAIYKNYKKCDKEQEKADITAFYCDARGNTACVPFAHRIFSVNDVRGNKIKMNKILQEYIDKNEKILKIDCLVTLIVSYIMPKSEVVFLIYPEKKL